MGLISNSNLVNWCEIKMISLNRKDSEKSCSICCDLFRDKKQICIKKLQKCTNQSICPICRQPDYEWIYIDDAAKYYRNLCSDKIKNFLRGVKTRKFYLNYRETCYPKNEKLKQFDCHRKIENLTNKLEKNQERLQGVTLDLFQICQNNIDKSKDLRIDSNVNWNFIYKKMVLRKTTECPICLGKLNRKNSKNILLSCSHYFHANCLNSYETYLQIESRNTNNCPLCRKNYTTLII
ncbi:hypothetical protein A3Q56_00553 [Intoshia linei]|uniref:RING-type domain-containing protein n=1 Tax=Intoshia linei TaxID=1819745 RepID=A0A177BBE9_9BILA|nr:hypothetical protein A3Q56_00553 [Intoshia linei]